MTILKNKKIFAIILITVTIVFLFLFMQNVSIKKEEEQVYGIKNKIMQQNIQIVIDKPEIKQNLVVTNGLTTAYSLVGQASLVIIPISILNQSNSIVQPDASMFILKGLNGKEYKSFYNNQMDKNFFSGKQFLFVQKLTPREIPYDSYLVFEVPSTVQNLILTIKKTFFGGGKDIFVQLD